MLDVMEFAEVRQLDTPMRDARCCSVAHLLLHLSVCRLARLSCRLCCRLSHPRRWWKEVAAVASSNPCLATSAVVHSLTISTAFPTACAQPHNARSKAA